MINVKSYTGVVIADIHMGAIKADILAEELDSIFIKYIECMKSLDFVMIAGDLFDTKLALNSKHTKRLFSFMKKLMNLCIEKDAKLRIIYGTEYHESNQLSTLQFLMKSKCDVKIYETVADEELYPDFNVLYIPEEYIKDIDEYYKDFFNNKYDMVIGHGMVNEVAFASKIQTSEVTMLRAPIFNTKKLLDLCEGPLFFGHIHKHQCIRDRLYYVGSFSRWCFGEEEPKGFMKVVYTPETKEYTTDFIENTKAKSYNTMVVDYNNTTDDMNYILNMINSVEYDKLRIIFNIPENHENPLLLSSMITDTFSKYKDIKIVINNNYKEKRKKMEQELKKLQSTFDFMMDDGMSVEEKICKFIKIKYNINISIDEMREYLYNKISL